MNNMKRMIWVAVAMLIMIGMMGFGLHSLNRITEVNKQRREKDKGEAFVAKILETTVTTSVWDKLRAKQDAKSSAPADGAGGNAIETDENGNQIVVQTDADGNAVVQDMGDGNIVVQTQIVPAQQDEPIEVVPDAPVQVVPDTPQAQFTTVAVPEE